MHTCIVAIVHFQEALKLKKKQTPNRPQTYIDYVYVSLI